MFASRVTNSRGRGKIDVKKTSGVPPYHAFVATSHLNGKLCSVVPASRTRCLAHLGYLGDGQKRGHESGGGTTDNLPTNQEHNFSRGFQSHVSTRNQRTTYVQLSQAYSPCYGTGNHFTAVDDHSIAFTFIGRKLHID